MNRQTRCSLTMRTQIIRCDELPTLPRDIHYNRQFSACTACVRALRTMPLAVYFLLIAVGGGIFARTVGGPLRAHMQALTDRVYQEYSQD